MVVASSKPGSYSTIIASMPIGQPTSGRFYCLQTPKGKIVKALFDCLTDELRWEIYRQYKEAIGDLDDLPENDAMAAMMVLVMVLPRGVETVHKIGEELKQEKEQAKEQAVEEKPKKRSRGGRRKAKTDSEIDEIAEDLLSDVNI
jgi:hypothetical protein